MRNRETVFYSLCEAEYEKEIFSYADNALEQDFNRNTSVLRWAPVLFIEENNRLFLLSIKDFKSLDKLHLYLDLQLQYYIEQSKETDILISKKAWFDHTQFICKDEYSKSKFEIFNEVSKWIDIQRLNSPETVPNKEDYKKQSIYKIFEELGQYNISQFLIQEGYKVETILELILNNSGPDFISYIIALLYEARYIDYLRNEFFTSNEERNEALSKILGLYPRAIKGNINVLNPRSEDDRTKYKSHEYQQKIKNDLLGLKLGPRP